MRAVLRHTLKNVGFAEAGLPERYENQETITLYSPVGVKVVIFPNDGGRVDVYGFQRGAMVWSMNFDGGVPDYAIDAAITAVATD
jgi:predicted Rdx family selenoprotein